MNLTKEYVAGTFRRPKNYELALSSSEISPELKSQLPDWWLEWIDCQSSAESVEKFKQQFAPFQKKLPESIKLIEQHLLGFCIMFIGKMKIPALLYVFKDNMPPHRAWLPLDEDNIPESILPFWPYFPAEFRQLVALHDGWLSLQSGVNGYLSTDRWELLSNMLESASVQKIKEEYGYHADCSVIISNDGLGRYLCFEFLGKGPYRPEPFIWQKDYIYDDLNFWHILDEWIRDMFEDS